MEYPVAWSDISRMYTRLRYQLDLQAKVVVAKVKRLWNVKRRTLIRKMYNSETGWDLIKKYRAGLCLKLMTGLPAIWSIWSWSVIWRRCQADPQTHTKDLPVRLSRVSRVGWIIDVLWSVNPTLTDSIFTSQHCSNTIIWNEIYTVVEKTRVCCVVQPQYRQSMRHELLVLSSSSITTTSSSSFKIIVLDNPPNT